MESPLKGKVLVASPQLLDPNFAQTIVWIVQHDEHGAMGMILNRPLETTVSEAWEQVSSVPYPNEDPIFQGGPCEGPLIVVHRDGSRGEPEIKDGIYVSSDADTVRSLVSDFVEPMKFFVGYAGWSPTQLESELNEGAWQVAAIDADEVFTTPSEIWTRLYKQTRSVLMPMVDPKLIPRDPSMN